MSLSSKSSDTALPDANAASFQVQLRSGIWGVKLDGKFHGDYRSLSQAMEGVDQKARSLHATGRAVEILTLSPGGAVLVRRLFGSSEP